MKKELEKKAIDKTFRILGIVLIILILTGILAQGLCVFFIGILMGWCIGQSIYSSCRDHYRFSIERKKKNE